LIGAMAAVFEIDSLAIYLRSGARTRIYKEHPPMVAHFKVHGIKD